MTAPTFYHGTRQAFRGHGGVLIPRSVHGGKPTTAPLNPGQEAAPDCEDYVYVTEDLDLAWVYAWHAEGRARPRVAEVTDFDDLEPDPESSARSRAWRCKFARVVRVHLEPTVEEAEARSGWVMA